MEPEEGVSELSIEMSVRVGLRLGEMQWVREKGWMVLACEREGGEDECSDVLGLRSRCSTPKLHRCKYRIASSTD